MEVKQAIIRKGTIAIERLIKRLSNKLPTTLKDSIAYTIASLYVYVRVIEYVDWLRRIIIMLTGKYGYEIFVSTFLPKIRGELFVDVGAHEGRYSLLLYRNFKHIIAIEPHPHHYSVLKQNVEFSGTENITCVEAAICDRNGYMTLYTSSDNPGGHSLLSSYIYFANPYRSELQLHNESITVKTCKLETLLQCKSRVDLVKVDVEGAEWEVLKSAEAILDKITRWIVEVHNLKKNRRIEAWFSFHGYKTRWLGFHHIYASR